MIDFSRFNSLVDIALYFDTPAKCKEEERFTAMFALSLGVFDYKTVTMTA